MTKLFATLLLLLITFTSADAQAFYRKNHKFRRAYMAKAITGGVHRPAVHAFHADQANFTTNEGSIEDERPQTTKAFRKAQRKAERAARRQARMLAREERNMHRAEQRALGDHLIANRTVASSTFSR